MRARTRPCQSTKAATDQQTVSGSRQRIVGTGAAGLGLGNIITDRPMDTHISLGTTLLAMSAPARMAAALGVSALLWLAVWWAL